MATFKKRILCIGDSNTWGFTPISGERYDDETRWTKILAKKLGDQYEVIEEGLNGRTTAYDDEGEDWLGKGRNCLKSLRSIIASHVPLDIVVVMLGTNDVKEKSHAGAADIRNNLLTICKGIIEFGQYRGKYPTIIVSTVADMHAKAGEIWSDFLGKEQMIQELNELIKKIESPVKVFDGNEYSKEPSEDGLHFTKESHKKYGEALAKMIESLSM